MIQQCLFMTAVDEDEFAGALLKARPSIRFINMREQPDNDRPRSVSYTHLDVYKRQRGVTVVQ